MDQKFVHVILAAEIDAGHIDGQLSCAVAPGDTSALRVLPLRVVGESNEYLDIEGLPQLRAALLKAGDLAPDALAAAGYEEMEGVMTEAKQLVPVDLGILRDSGQVLPPTQGPDGVEIVAGFGGAASAYTIRQHEDLSLEHPNGGQAKFLEQPMLERTKLMPKRLAVGVERALRRLGT